MLLEALAAALQEFVFLLAYIADRQSFPQPLSAEKEAECVARMANGDENARCMLIEHNQRLVAHIAKKYQSTGIDMQDLISIGTIGLIKAVSTFRPGNNTLATYAARCIDNEILMTIRANKRTKKEVSLSEPIGTDKDGFEISLMDILSAQGEDVIEQVERQIEVARINRLIDSVLTEREQVVMRLRYGLKDGVVRAQREVAKELDISRSYVSRIEKKAIQTLREKMRSGGARDGARDDRM